MPTHLAFTSAWQDIRSNLRASVGGSAYDVWLAALEVKHFDGSVLVLQGKPGTDAWVADRFGRVLERCARHTLGDRVTVAFATETAATARDAIVGAAHIHPDHPAERFNPRYTFDQFVIGDSNRVAHAAALAVAEAPAQTINPLFLHAPSGLGKTHLLHAIGNYITRFDPGTSVRYTTVEAFTNGFISALRGKALERFKHIYRDVDVLLIDDVQFLASKARTEEEFFHTFNALYDSGRQLVLTCDRLPDQLTAIDRRLRQRFEAGLVEHISRPDRATRLAILRKRAALDGLEISDQAVFELIADRVTDNVRALEGSLQRLAAHHSLTGRPLDRELATAVLADARTSTAAGSDATTPTAAAKPAQPAHHATPSAAAPNAHTDRSPQPPAITQIQATVAAAFNISTAELTSRSRVAAVTWPRELAIHLSRELTGAPLAAIGAAFGGRSHATILHACKRVQDRTSASVEDAAELEQLTRTLSNAADRRSTTTDRPC